MAETTTEKAPEELIKTEEKPAKKSLDEDAFHNFLQGKRHILVKDFPHAVQSLAKACELYAEHYGQQANECGDVFFLYGKALFNLYQQQAGLFGDTVPEGSEEEEEDEEERGDSDEEKEKGSNDEEDENKDEEGNQENEDKEDDSESVSSSKDGEKTDSMDASKPETETEIKDNDISSNVNDSSSEPSASTTEPPQKESQTCESNSHQDVAKTEAGPSTSQSKPQKSEEDISDLQLAWENLEIAKNIFEKQGAEAADAQLKVAEILLILGDISLECDNYQAAIKDFEAGLSIWHHRLPSDDRRIAEAFYQLGRAYQLNDESDKAIEYYEKTIELIELRINILKNQTEIKQNADGFDIDPNVEIAELEALIPDLKAKMEDAQELDKETKKAIQETLHKMEEVKVTSTSDEKPVMNISHLLKRKKPDDQESSKGGEAKKIKLTNSNNSSPSRNIEEQVQSTSEATPPPRA